ncbi:hypothetical protein [Gaoshiqia sediminis]|uniref:Uncharacterized protein n=1 Tax=Gaoshiqia sediminis TaxID=2986998 RepID=A0AA41YAN8_9BACT|nr:hypothetical protein [Gaoshiqia sediminis]MCW0484123.1 hypothetical protein [Gaoshiqia sediminis]
MKAIEIKSKTDNSGHLRIDFPLNKKDCNVRLLILIEEDYATNDEEQLWMESVTKNPAFDFLKEPQEDIYKSTDGEPFNV